MNLFLNKLTITNLQSYKKAVILFQKNNLISGYNFDAGCGNGSGKTTVVYGILFALYGDKLIDKKISSLVNKDASSCEVELELEAKGHSLKIIRRIPTKIELYIDGVFQDIIGVSENQRKICEFVGDLETFKKFRIMDKTKGVNILDFSSRQLKKTLMGFSEDKFENIRQKLLKIKTEREKFNKDQVLFKHYPSEKRKSILEKGKEAIQDKESIIEADVEVLNSERSKNSVDQGKIGKQIEITEKQVKSMKEMGTCPSCLQVVPDTHKESICKELLASLSEMKKVFKELNSSRAKTNNHWNSLQSTSKKLREDSSKITRSIYKLEARFKQKNYKYTEKDIIVVKKAIEALDHFATYYIIEWIKVVEPIVNSHITKLNMYMKFLVDEKQNISVTINRNGTDYLYEELSAGEKLFVSFAFNIALLIEQQESGFIIADEGLDLLSPENLERIFSIIEDTEKQLICVSQHRDLRMENINLISVEKRNDVSEITKENEL